MRGVVALRVPLNEDLLGFVTLLRRLRIPHRVSEEAGQQVLWVPDQALATQVVTLYQRYPQGHADLPAAELPVRENVWLAQLKQAPAVVVLLLLTFAVAALTAVGENHSMIRWFTFTDFRIEGDRVYLQYLQAMLADGQWWRLFTPMLLHFGWLHLAMNSLWLWELGRRVEMRQGAFQLLVLCLSFSLVSNLAQYLYSGPSLFGGLSGVLYGLLGYCWLYQVLCPNPAYRLPSGVVALMLVWLVVCMTGVFEFLGLAAIANAAHLGGLLAGCVVGVAAGWLARRRQP